MTRHKFKRGDLIRRKLTSAYSPLIVLKLDYFKDYYINNDYNLEPFIYFLTLKL